MPTKRNISDAVRGITRKAASRRVFMRIASGMLAGIADSLTEKTLRRR